MTSSDPAAPTPADILRPALWLWIGVELARGLLAQAHALLPPDPAESAWAAWLLHGVNELVFAILVLAFVLPDREARSIWVPVGRRVVEQCVVVGGCATALLVAWQQLLSGPWSWFRHGAQLPLWAELVYVAVFAAVLEELMYRGLLLQRLRRVLPLGVALATQAMLFAVAHLDTVTMLPKFFFGVATGYLRVVAGGLWPCVLMHLGWNTFYVLLDRGLV